MGQKKPPRRKGDETFEDGEYMEYLDEFGYIVNKRGTKGNNGSGSTKTRGGYGMPTKGEYDVT